MLATKSIVQTYADETLRKLLFDCLEATEKCVRFGEEKGIKDRRKMKEFYRSLKDLQLPSCYKTGIISRACAVLKSREKSRKRGKKPIYPKPLKPAVCITSGFFVTAKGKLFVPVARNEYAEIKLNRYAAGKLVRSRRKVEMRSLTITMKTISVCYSREIDPLPVSTVYGMDRNEKSIYFGNGGTRTVADLSKTVRIRQNTREIVGSFKRNDVRIRRKIASKYWTRSDNRCEQIYHDRTNQIIDIVFRDRAAIAYEDLTGMNRMYRRGNGKGKDYRFRLNQFPYGKMLKYVQYKAAWEGLTTIALTKEETYGSSSRCFRCGERLSRPEMGDRKHERWLWCSSCKMWVHRDVNAETNLVQRGLSRLTNSLPKAEGRMRATTYFLSLCSRRKGRQVKR